MLIPAPRIPEELLKSDLPDWVKIVWLTIRKVQGNNESAFASSRHYADLCGKEKSNTNRAIRDLVCAGWMSRNGQKLTCLIPTSEVQHTPNEVQGTSEGEVQHTSGEVQHTSGEVQHTSGEVQGTTPSESSQLIQSINPVNESFIGEKKKSKRFRPPTLEEAKDFFRVELDREDLAEGFFYHHEAADWMIKNRKMKAWKAAARYWRSNDEKWHGKSKNSKRKNVRRSPNEQSREDERKGKFDYDSLMVRAGGGK